MIKSIFNYVTGNVRNGYVRKTIYQNPEAINKVERVFYYYKGGFHGTTLEQLGDQIEAGKFEQKGRSIYYHNFETAARYSTERAEYAVSWDPETQQFVRTPQTPVVVRVISTHKPEWNDPTPDGMGRGLGLYPYFPSGAEVRIEEVYVIEPVKE